MKHPFLLLPILFSCTPAWAQPPWISESRSIHANVYAFGATNGDSQGSDGNLLLFERTVYPNATGACSFDGMVYGESSATADVMQRSEFEPGRFTAAGSAAMYLGEANADVLCGSSGDSGSGGTAEFRLDAATTFSLVYELTCEIGSASINLYHRDSDTYIFQVARTSPGTEEGVLNGPLAAGRYLLDWDASTSAQTGGPASTRAAYDFGLEIVVTVPCIADFNGDGGVDGSDVEAFFVAWEAGESSADVNNDGGVDGGDAETFFVAWEAGGCN